MFSEDYLLRMINQAAAALLRILGLKKAGKYQAALQAIDQTLEQLLNLKSDIVKQLDDKSLLQMLTKEDRLDISRLGLVADLFKEEGDILAAQQRFLESRASYLRSLTYSLEISFDETSREVNEPAEKIDELVQHISIQNLPDETCWTLFCHYEQSGAYEKAENTLIEMAERTAVHTEIQLELIAFYERLLQQPANAFAASKMDPAEVHSKLEKVRSGQVK